MKIFTISIICVVILFGALFTRQAWRIAEYGKRTDYAMQPFERINLEADLRILFLGDSTIVGTGASSNEESTAGWFGQDFPEAHIVNFSRNGLRLEGLLEELNPEPGEHYDLTVAQIGANDILYLTPLSLIRSRISHVVDRLKAISDTVVILHSGHVGLAPIFVWPADEILGWQSRKVREIYQEVARDKGALYVDLYTVRRDDPFLKDINRYYAADLLHPSGQGYRIWYERIRQTLDEAGVRLPSGPRTGF